LGSFAPTNLYNMRSSSKQPRSAALRKARIFAPNFEQDFMDSLASVPPRVHRHQPKTLAALCKETLHIGPQEPFPMLCHYSNHCAKICDCDRERTKSLYCSQCGIHPYCCVAQQRADYPKHKRLCVGLRSASGILDDNVAAAQYVHQKRDACDMHARACRVLDDCAEEVCNAQFSGALRKTCASIITVVSTETRTQKAFVLMDAIKEDMEFVYRNMFSLHGEPATACMYVFFTVFNWGCDTIPSGKVDIEVPDSLYTHMEYRHALGLPVADPLDIADAIIRCAGLVGTNCTLEMMSTSIYKNNHELWLRMFGARDDLPPRLRSATKRAVRAANKLPVRVLPYDEDEKNTILVHSLHCFAFVTSSKVLCVSRNE
jgi:hypothetical protein